MPSVNAIRGPTTSAPDIAVVTVTDSPNVAVTSIASPLCQVPSSPAEPSSSDTDAAVVPPTDADHAPSPSPSARTCTR